MYACLTNPKENPPDLMIKDPCYNCFSDASRNCNNCNVHLCESCSRCILKDNEGIFIPLCHSCGKTGCMLCVKRLIINNNKMVICDNCI